MNDFKRYRIIVLCTELALLVILFGFLIVWGSLGSPGNIIDQIEQQRARSERIEKDALILEYRSDQDERSQALAELQDTLAPLSQTQQAMQSGDASLNLPSNPPPGVIALVNQSSADFYPIEVAANNILAHHTPIDPLEVQIILTHEHSYVTSVNNISLAWEAQISDTYSQLFYIKATIVLVLVAVVLFDYRACWIYREKIKKTLREEGVQLSFF